MSDEDAFDAERWRFLVANWNSTIDGEPLHLWLGRTALRYGGISAALDHARAALTPTQGAVQNRRSEE